MRQRDLSTWPQYEAAALGFRHAILAWRGPKPSTGLQAAAREARYQLTRDYMDAQDIATLLQVNRLIPNGPKKSIPCSFPVKDLAGIEGHREVKIGGVDFH